jgi:hypothetical protein
MGLSLSWEDTNRSPIQSFPEFYKTRRSITVFTIARHWSLSQINPVYTTPFYLSKTHFNIILHMRLSPLVICFLLVFPLKPCTHSSSLPRMRHGPHISSSLILPFYIWGRVQAMKLPIIQYSTASPMLLC